MRRPDNNEHYYAKQAVENRKSKQELLVRIYLHVCALRLDDDSDVHIHPIYTPTCWSAQLDVPCTQRTKGWIWKKKPNQSKTKQLSVTQVSCWHAQKRTVQARRAHGRHHFLYSSFGRGGKHQIAGSNCHARSPMSPSLDEAVSLTALSRVAPVPGTTSRCALPAGLTQGGSAPLWRR